MSTAVRSTSSGQIASTSAEDQRTDRVKGLDAGQDRRGLGAGMAQHRGQRDGDLGDCPGVRQVAEVDDAVRKRDRVGRDTTTLASVRSRCTAWRGRSSARGAIRDHASAAAVVSDRERGSATCPTRAVDDVVAVAEVPLQRAVQAGMAEVRQGAADSARQLAHACDDRRRQVARVEQRAARQEPQEPDVGGSVDQVGHRRGRLAREVRQRHRDPQRRLRRGDSSAAASCAASSVCGEGGVGDLQNTEHPVVVVVDQEVLVLVAAKGFHPRGQAVVGRQQLVRPAPR